MTIFWCLVLVFGGAAIGAMGMALGAMASRSDLQIEAIGEKCRADVAHVIGNLMEDELRGFLARKDLSVRQRGRIDGLVARWADLVSADTDEKDPAQA